MGAWNRAQDTESRARPTLRCASGLRSQGGEKLFRVLWRRLHRLVAGRPACSGAKRCRPDFGSTASAPEMNATRRRWQRIPAAMSKQARALTVLCDEELQGPSTCTLIQERFKRLPIPEQLNPSNGYRSHDTSSLHAPLRGTSLPMLSSTPSTPSQSRPVLRQAGCPPRGRPMASSRSLLPTHKATRCVKKAMQEAGRGSAEAANDKRRERRQAR